MTHCFYASHATGELGSMQTTSSALTYDGVDVEICHKQAVTILIQSFLGTGLFRVGIKGRTGDIDSSGCFCFFLMDAPPGSESLLSY